MPIKYLHIDLRQPTLVMPDGTLATSLRLGPLWAQLQELRIPGITAKMGKQDLLNAYAQHVASVAKTIIGPEKLGSKRPTDISAAVLRQAAEIIAQQAAAPIGSEPSVSRPIATTSVRG